MKKKQPKKLAPAGETWREGVCLWRSSESWCSDDLLNLVHEWNKCDCKGLLIYSHCATLLMVITLCRWWLWAAHRDVALLTLHAVCWYITFWWEWQIDCWAQQKPFIKSKVEQLSPNCNHNSFTSHRGTYEQVIWICNRSSQLFSCGLSGLELLQWLKTIWFHLIAIWLNSACVFFGIF